MAKKIGNIISTILLIVLLLIAAILYLPKIFGITPMVVLSGSMEPTYPVGSLIFVSNTEASELEVGDKITFYFNKSSTVVTHRIKEKNADEKYFVTKGDNNNTVDGEKLPYSEVIGKASDFAIPFMGYLAVYLNTTSGIILLVGIALITVVIMMLCDTKPKKKGAAKHEND